MARKSGLKFVHSFQRWSRGNDEECKLIHSIISLNNQLHFPKEASKSNPLFVH